MSRMLFIAFLALAVIAGLVFVSNPQVREQAENSWQEVKPTLIEWREKIEIEIRDPFAQGESDVQANPETAPSEESSPDDDPLVTFDWDAIWSALKRIWSDITA